MIHQLLTHVIILVFTLMTVIPLVTPHQRLVYPPARTTDSGLKSYPCGGVSRTNAQTVTTLTANTVVTIQFEETISHAGSPFRIALSYDDDSHFDELVLQDHIPHNDQSTSDSTKKYSYNLRIPDVTCDQCTLQIVNPMTDKISLNTCCYYPSTANRYGHQYCSSVYHSCANVKIVGGKTTIQQFAKTYKYEGTCGPYTQEKATYVSASYGYRLTNGDTSRFTNTCEGFKNQCSANSPLTSTSLSSDCSKRFKFSSLMMIMIFMVIGLVQY